MTIKQFCALSALWIVVIAIAATLSGCSERLDELSEAARQEKKAYNDVKAINVSEIACDQSLGAWGRRTDKIQRNADFAKCVEDHADYGVTVTGGGLPTQVVP